MLCYMFQQSDEGFSAHSSLRLAPACSPVRSKKMISVGEQRVFNVYRYSLANRPLYMADSTVPDNTISYNFTFTSNKTPTLS